MIPYYSVNRELHSFPTRRSSDLSPRGRDRGQRVPRRAAGRSRAARPPGPRTAARRGARRVRGRDRKSTRLNSSHVAISYAVFCLKKKSEQVLILHARQLIELSTT